MERRIITFVLFTSDGNLLLTYMFALPAWNRDRIDLRAAVIDAKLLRRHAQAEYLPTSKVTRGDFLVTLFENCLKLWHRNGLGKNNQNIGQRREMRIK